MYTKVIQSGDLIEVFQYEKFPNPPRKKRSRRRKGASIGRRYHRNVYRAQRNFSRLVRANLFGLKRMGAPVLLTLTMLRVVSIEEAWAVYTSFCARFKRGRRDPLYLVGVPEFQKRGAVHFHALVWGLTNEEIIGERDTRRIQISWREGYVDIVPTDGSPKLATYLSKYMLKAVRDYRLNGKKAYSASRGVMRSVSLSTEFAVDTAFEAWGINVDSVPLTVASYRTEYLGTCNYKTYSLSDAAKD